jgi:hypothetical protein
MTKSSTAVYLVIAGLSLGMASLQPVDSAVVNAPVFSAGTVEASAVAAPPPVGPAGPAVAAPIARVTGLKPR